MSTDSIRECVECGRRGVREFEPAGVAWRCTNGEQCLHRQHNQVGEPGGHTPPNDDGNDSKGDATVTAVAGLAREVQALREAVERARGLPLQVDDLARVVQQLAQQVTARAGRSAVVAPSWLDLPGDLATAQALLRDLIGWLGDVYLRYPDATKTLPECWLWHPDIVEELTWLMVAWHAAYRDENATVQQAGDWHDRYRPGVVRRIKAGAGTCSLDTHLPRRDRVTGGRPVVPLADAMQSIADWWSTRRPDPAPTPSDEQRATTDRRGAAGRQP